MKSLIIIFALLMAGFVLSKMSRWYNVSQWRKQIKRGSMVSFFHAGRWRRGYIQHFKNLGKSVIVRWEDDTGQKSQIALPLNILVPFR